MLWLLGSWYVFGFALIYWFGYQLFFKGPKKGSLEESWNQIDPQHRQRTQRRKLACFFAMLGSFGFLFLAVASMIYNSYNPNRFTWDALDGQVVTVARLPSGELKNCYVRYVYGGVTYRQMVRKDLDRELERDSLIPLLVDPNNPRHVEVRRNFFFLPCLVAVISLLTMVFGFGQSILSLLGRSHFEVKNEDTPKTFGAGPIPMTVIKGKGMEVGWKSKK